jgi:hypothetical protein
MAGRGIRDEDMKETTCPWLTLCMYVYSVEVGNLCHDWPTQSNPVVYATNEDTFC